MSRDARSEQVRYSREQVVAVLARIGIRGAEADAILHDLTFPMTWAELQERAGRHGITHDMLISELGGSP